MMQIALVKAQPHNFLTTLKRLYLDQGSKCVRLKPENKNMKDIVTANCSIQGIAVKIMKDLV